MSEPIMDNSEHIRRAAAEIDALTTRENFDKRLPNLIAIKWGVGGHDILTLMDEINALGRQRLDRMLRENKIIEPVATFMRIKGRVQNELPVLRLRIVSGDWKK